MTDFDRRSPAHDLGGAEAGTRPGTTPGKRTLTDRLPPARAGVGAAAPQAAAPTRPGSEPVDDPYGFHVEEGTGTAPVAALSSPGGSAQSVRDPIVRNAAREAAELPGRFAHVRKLASDYARARDQLDGGSVAEIGLALVAAYTETQVAVARLNEGTQNADLLGAVGVEYAWDPDGTRARAREEELTVIKETAADLTVELGGSSPLLAQAIRPATFRHTEVPGQDELPHPADVPAYLREQTVKTILLIDTAEEIQTMLAGAEGQAPDVAAALRKEAASRLQFWLSDRDGFLFLSHALRKLGHGALLDERGQDGEALTKTVEAVTRGVPQTIADVIATVRDAKGHGLDHDQPGALSLLGLARERVDELTTYEKVKAALPDGTNGLTFDHALFFAQEARDGLREQARDLTRAGQLAEGLWDLRLRQLETAAPVLRVITGETAYAESPLAAVGPAQKLSLIGTGAVGGMVVGGAAGAAWISANAATIAEVAAGAYSAAVIAIVRNPYAATALAEFIASLGFNIGEAGLENFLESLKTPEGVMQLVMDILVLKQSMGGGRHGEADAADAPRRAPQVDEGSEFGAKVRDVFDRARALKAATVEWAKQPRRGGAAQAVTPEGEPMPVPGRAGGDELPTFSEVYTQQLATRRGARAARGGGRMWPTAEQRLEKYHPPPAGKDAVEVRERLLVEAKERYPTPPDMPEAERIEQYHRQTQYFEKVERMAREHREELEAKRLHSPDEDGPSLQDDIGGTHIVEAAARARPTEGRLPINHADAGKTITLEMLDQRIADLSLPQSQRAALQRARKAIAEAGATEFRVKEDGYPAFEPFVYKGKGGVPADVEIALGSGKGRDADFLAARDAYREKIGDPSWQKPRGYTWHHHEQVGRMILVPTDIHDAFRHTGSIPLFRILVGDLSAYRGDDQ